MGSHFESGITSVSDIEASQERTRVFLAIAVMALVAIVVIVILLRVKDFGGNDAAKLMITGIFTPIIGIAGTVLGFYFGSKSDG